MTYSSQRLCNMFRYLCLVAAYIGTFLFSTQGTATDFLIDDAIEFHSTDCWVTLKSEDRVDCGWLVVPENWEQPEAQKLKLPVAILRPLNPDPALAPIVYLSGGPGDAALGKNGADIKKQRALADYYFPGRTLIVYDQRGTGLGSPKLDCPDGDGPMVWFPVSNNPEEFGHIPSRVHAAYASCAERHLAAGRQLTAFNTVQSATDVEALRRALKLKSIVLFGISYGTRLALTVMKHYPQGVEAVILDSVWPPIANNINSLGPVLDRLFQACSQDKNCNAAYPDLPERFLQAMKNLADEPAVFEISNLEDNRKPLYARIDHTWFLEVLRTEMYHGNKIPYLPLLISDVSRGEYWRLRAHVEGLVFDGWPDRLDMGANIAVECNDDVDVDVVKLQQNLDNAKTYTYLRDYTALYLKVSPCAIWPTQPNTGNHFVVTSDAPSLLLAGAFDTGTSVEQAELAAATLSMSHLFVFPASGHWQTEHKCSWEIIAEFLAAPTTRPNPKCFASLPKPKFLTKAK